MTSTSSAPDAVALRRTDSVAPATHSPDREGAVVVNGIDTAEGATTGTTPHIGEAR